MNRRKYVSVTALSLTSLAGCSGDIGDINSNNGDDTGGGQSNEASPSSSSENEQETTSDAADRNESTTSAQDSSTDESPGPAERVVREYLTAIDAGDMQTKEELLHENAAFSPREDPYSLTINRVERMSLSEIAEREGLSSGEERITDEQIQQAEQNIWEQDLSDSGADDYGFVFFDVSSENAYMLLVEDGGDWYVYLDVTKRLMRSLFVDFSDYEPSSS